MATVLRQADVDHLMAQPSPQVRAIIIGKLAIEMERPDLSPSELLIAQDIIRKLAADVQVVVRRALAHNLRRSTRLPHDIALKLAHDVEAVALPILTDSEILTNDDLLSILQNSSTLKQKAIASRDHLPQMLSDTIIGSSNEVVVTALMENKTAEITEKGLITTIARFGNSDLVKESMIKRLHLPLLVSDRLAMLVSDRLKEYLIEHHALSPPVLAEISRQSQERAIIQLSHERSADDIEQLIAQMHEDGRLTPSLMVRALCVGNLPFFEYAVAAFASIPVANARLLVHDEGKNGLDSLWQKTGIEARFLPLVRAALDVMFMLKLDGEEHDVKRFRARVIERILTQLEGASGADVDYLLEQLQ